MAKEPKQANAPKIEFDDLTNKLVLDPATIPDDSVALAGFVGQSAEEGNIRLYVDANFRNYYEISRSDVLYSQQLPTTQSPLGGSVVYVKGGAPLRRVQVSTEIEARFLQGPMSSAGVGTAGASSPTGANRAFYGLHATLIPAICNAVTLSPRNFRCVSNAPTSCPDVGCRGRTDQFECGGGGITNPFDC
jgi:hypothetical protein